MSIIYYVADPPQWARLKVVRSLDTEYQVGDRIATVITDFNSTASVRVYRCTVAGTSASSYAGAPSTDGQASFVWGTSTWELITPNSWANASPVPITWIYNNTDHIINYIDYTTENTDTTSGMELSYTNTRQEPRAVRVFVNPATMLPMNSVRRYAGGNTYERDPVQQDPFFFGHTTGGHYCRSPMNLTYSTAGTINNPTLGFVDADLSFGASTVSLRQCFGASFRCSGTIGVDTTGTDKLYGITQLPLTAGGSVAVTTTGGTIFGIHSPAVPSNKAAYEAATTIISTARSHLMTRWTMSKYESYAGTTTRKSVCSGHACSFLDSSDCYRAAGFSSWETPSSLRLTWSTTPDISPDMSRPVFAPTIVVQNALTGSRTVTLRLYTDCSIPLTDLDVWFDLFYGSSATAFTYANATTMNANYGAPFATGTALTTDSGWTEVANVFQGTAYKIQRTVTINKASPLIVRLAVASDKFYYTARGFASPGFRLYIDPNIEVT